MDLIERSSGPSRRHPWETSRLATLRRLTRSLPLSADDAVLDVGCGDGFVLAGLFDPDGAPVRVGVDAHFTDDDLAELARSHPKLSFVRELGPSSPRVYRLVLLLDVLEHVDDHGGFLRELVAERVAPGGWVLVTVPAYQALYGRHDRELRHVRRYDPGQLREVATSAGLRILRSGHLYGSLLPLRWVSTRIQSLLGWNASRSRIGVSDWNRGRISTRAIDFALRAENRFLLTASARGWDIPGLTEWMLCQKS